MKLAADSDPIAARTTTDLGDVYGHECGTPLEVSVNAAVSPARSNSGIHGVSSSGWTPANGAVG